MTPGAQVVEIVFAMCVSISIAVGVGYLAHWLLRSIGRHK